MAQRDVAARLADLEPVSRGGTVHGSRGVAAMMERDFPCCEAPGGHDVQPAPPAFTLAELHILRRGLAAYYNDLLAVAGWSTDVAATEALSDRLSLMIRDLNAK